MFSAMTIIYWNMRYEVYIYTLYSKKRLHHIKSHSLLCNKIMKYFNRKFFYKIIIHNRFCINTIL